MESAQFSGSAVALDGLAALVGAHSRRGGVVDLSAGRLFLGEHGFGGAELVAGVGVGGQHRVVGDERAHAGVVHGDPLDRVGRAVLSEDLEDVRLQIARGADVADVVGADVDRRAGYRARWLTGTRPAQAPAKSGL